EVAIADGLARALETTGRLGHRLLLRVRDLVLDVAPVADLGHHLLQADARLLHLAGVGNDRQELGLRLREDLAGPDLVEILAGEVGVDRVRRTSTLRDGLDDRRRAGAHVAGPEDTA